MTAIRSEFSSDEEMDLKEENLSFSDLQQLCSKISPKIIEIMDDDSLFKMLREDLNVDIGPVVDSTRDIYKKLLWNKIEELRNGGNYVSTEYANGVGSTQEVSANGDLLCGAEVVLEDEENVLEVREEDFDLDDDTEVEDEYSDNDGCEGASQPPVTATPKPKYTVTPPRPCMNVYASRRPPALSEPIEQRKVEVISSKEVSNFFRNTLIVGFVSVFVGLYLLYTISEPSK